jgi:hypothetical protein
VAKIPRVIKWGFDPDKSEMEALRNPQDRILWSVLRSGHVVDQHFNGKLAEFGRYIRQYPPADAQTLAELAHRRFGLHGYGVAPYARMPFEADLEWWGELLEAWRGNTLLEHELPAGVATADEGRPGGRPAGGLPRTNNLSNVSNAPVTGEQR